MNKNVIYTIDCVFEDEWHRKKIAKEKLLKDRKNMSDEHVSSMFDWPWFSDEHETWSHITKHQIKKYCEKVNADLVVLNSQDAFTLDLPDTWTVYQRANLLKFHALIEFSKSKYEKFLCLDLDILIDQSAPSIFDEYKDGFRMYADGNPTFQKTEPIKLKKHFNIDSKFLPLKEVAEATQENKLKYFQENTLYNGGVIFCDISTAKKFCSVVPQNNEWKSFLTKHKLESNPFFEGLDQINDQDFIQVFLRWSKINPMPLNASWNSGLLPRRDLFTQEPAAQYFIHLCGSIGNDNPRKLLPFLSSKNSVNKLLAFSDLIRDNKLEIL